MTNLFLMENILKTNNKKILISVFTSLIFSAGTLANDDFDKAYNSFNVNGKRLINHTFQIIFPSVNLPTVLITGDTDEFIKPKKMVEYY